MMESMVERVARAICLARHEDPDATWEREGERITVATTARWQRCVPEAIAAIQAMTEPTEAMCAALEFGPAAPADALNGTCRSIWLPSYRAMIQAALPKEG